MNTITVYFQLLGTISIIPKIIETLGPKCGFLHCFLSDTARCVIQLRLGRQLVIEEGVLPFVLFVNTMRARTSQ